MGLPTNADDAQKGFGLFLPKENHMYALIKDAYIDIAKENGLLPRQLQSVIWEAQRTGVNAKKRTEKTEEEMHN